jgi:thioredoxin-related protein
MKSCAPQLTTVILLCWLGGQVNRALADEVQWRSDYALARKEAAEKNKPLLLDFGTEDCFWCRRLDLDTFRNPAVVSLVNEQFVPLRVDGQKDARLVETLSIRSYPTLVFAGPNGKILGVQEGYADAERIYDLLRRAAAMSSPPDGITHDYQEATKAIAAGDVARAIVLLKAVVEDGKERPVQVRARGMLRDIEQEASALLARARLLAEQGHKAEAVAAAGEISRVYAGSQAAKDAGQLLARLSGDAAGSVLPRSRKANELLLEARDEFKAKQYLACLERCEIIALTYGDLQEGVEATQLAAEIKANPDRMKLACDQLGDRLGSYYLALAESHAQKGQPREAAACLERVMQMFPGSRHADAAKVRLARLRQESAGAAESRKP